jgi:HEAT repeat protein
MKQLFHNKLIQMRSPVASRQMEALTEIEQQWDDSRIQKFCTFLDHIDDPAAASIAPVLARATTPELIFVLCRFALRDDAFLQKTVLRLLQAASTSLRADCAVILLQKSADPPVRRAACELLASAGNDGRKEILFEALAEREPPEVIRAALEAVRELRYAAAMPHLCTLLERTQSTDLLADTLNTLAALPPSPHFPSATIIRLLQSAPETRIREAAAFALGSSPAPAHCDALIAILRNDRESNALRCAAARALQSCDSAETITALLETCTKTADIPLTLTCKQALQAMSPDTVVDLAGSQLNSQQPRMRMEAAILLGELAINESYPLLKQHYTHETNQVVKAALLEAIGSMHQAHPDVIDLLLSAMHDAPVIAYTAVSTLGEQLNDEILPRFINELADTNNSAYWEGALSALLLYVRSNKLPNALLEQIIALLNSPHRHQAWLAAEVCGWMSMREAATPLVAALEQNSHDENLHLVIARALMHLFQNDLLALAEWLAPERLQPLASIINREVDLGRTGQQLIRRLAEFAAQDYPGSIEALYACAQLEPQEFAAATDDVEAEAIPHMLRIWRELDPRQKRKAPLKWEHWLSSIDPRLRRNALEYLDTAEGAFYLPAVIDLATNDTDLTLRLLARDTVRRLLTPPPPSPWERFGEK